jgi:hypothetical protein
MGAMFDRFVHLMLEAPSTKASGANRRKPSKQAAEGLEAA